MKKVVRDGKVAVILSVGYGIGWYSWNKKHKELLYHPKLVEMVEQKRTNEIDEEWIEKNLGIKDINCEDVSDLKIEWLSIGTKFKVDDYDGYESIITVNDLNLTA